MNVSLPFVQLAEQTIFSEHPVGFYNPLCAYVHRCSGVQKSASGVLPQELSNLVLLLFNLRISYLSTPRLYHSHPALFLLESQTLTGTLDASIMQGWLARSPGIPLLSTARMPDSLGERRRRNSSPLACTALFAS